MKFSLAETRLFSAAASALVDRPVREDDVEPFLDDVAKMAPTHVAWGLRGILWLAWMSPLVTGRGPKPFEKLAHDERVALWSWALDHPAYPVRQLALTAKAMVCLCLFDEPRSAEERAA